MITLTHAMVLAAGLGTRMRPLTAERPKPLLPLAGRTLLEHVLDRLAAAGIREVVINTHWYADQIATVIAGYAQLRITLLHEPTLLETGGAVARALPLLGEAPFVVVNGDAFWLDGPTPTLARLAASFAPDRMDALLMVVRTTEVRGPVGHGDFMLDPLGRMRRPGEREIAPYLFAGVQILVPELFHDCPTGPFSLNLLYDRAAARGRLFGMVHDGVWFHLSRPEDLAHAEEVLRSGLVRALF